MSVSLLLITNRKSDSSSMTLNNLERRNSPYLEFFSPNSIDFYSDYITVVEDKPIMSVKYCLPVAVSLLAKTITHPCSAVSLR